MLGVVVIFQEKRKMKILIWVGGWHMNDDVCCLWKQQATSWMRWGNISIWRIRKHLKSTFNNAPHFWSLEFLEDCMNTNFSFISLNLNNLVKCLNSLHEHQFNFTRMKNFSSVGCRVFSSKRIIVVISPCFSQFYHQIHSTQNEKRNIFQLSWAPVRVGGEKCFHVPYESISLWNIS